MNILAGLFLFRFLFSLWYSYMISPSQKAVKYLDIFWRVMIKNFSMSTKRLPFTSQSIITLYAIILDTAPCYSTLVQMCTEWKVPYYRACETIFFYGNRRRKFLLASIKPSETLQLFSILSKNSMFAIWFSVLLNLFYRRYYIEGTQVLWENKYWHNLNDAYLVLSSLLCYSWELKQLCSYSV